jgi:hypothetical protein
VADREPQDGGLLLNWGMSYTSEFAIWGFLLLLTPATMPVGSSEACGAPSFTLPSTITLENGLERIVAPALRYSPRFREQCRVLAATRNLKARVRVGLRRAGATHRASAVVHRGMTGTLAADIEIIDPAHATELLAHELEHLIEQIDGIDLNTLAGRGVAHRVKGGAFETERAIAAGKRVAGEVFDNAPDTLRGAGGQVWRALKAAVMLK